MYTHTISLIVPILMNMANNMVPIHTRLVNDMFANFAMFRYMHNGIVTANVQIKTITSRFENIDVGFTSVSRTTTFVTVSPTTTLYETIAKKMRFNDNFITNYN